MTRREIDRRFNLHKPTTGGGLLCNEVRAAIKYAACQVIKLTPANREQAIAIGKLEEALYFAIAAIVRPDVE